MALALWRTLTSRNSPTTPDRRMGNSPPASTCTSSPTTKRTKLEGSDGYIDLMCSQQLRPQAKFKELLEGLAQNSRDVRAVGEHGMTALHYSVLNNDELCTKALIVFGAGINAKNNYDMTPLDIALQNQVYDLVPLLVSIGCKIGKNVPQGPTSPGSPGVLTTSAEVIKKRIDSGISNCSRSRSHSRSPSPPSKRSSRCEDARFSLSPGASEACLLRDSGDDTLSIAASEACAFGRDGDFLSECPDCCTPKPRLSRQTYHQLSERRHEEEVRRVTETRRVSADGSATARNDRISLGVAASEACVFGRDGDCLSECPDCCTPRPRVDKQTLYHKLSDEIERRYEMDKSLNPDELLQMAMQQQELTRFRSEEQLQTGPEDDSDDFGSSIEFKAEGGSRILSLDGGGIRGLLQIEILSEIERLTGKKITELFDVIMGTSTGGIVALGLVYCKKTLSDLRQLYFRLREQIFANSRMGSYDTTALEEILKTEMGTDMKMSDVDHPKVLISAVDKSTTQLKLRFFNNIFHDEYSTQPIWQVARYTSAAPLAFTECDNYVDGGILANNPCENGLMRIQRFYREQEQGRRMPIACVVSVGSGISPAEALGSTSIPLGFQMLRVINTVRRTQNFMTLLAEAIVESEAVAEKCRGICEEQNIPFFRFSPRLEEKIESGETDSLKLIAMIIKAKICTNEDPEMGKLVSRLCSRNAGSRTSPLPPR